MEQDSNPQPLRLFQMICLHPNCQISAVDSACQLSIIFRFQIFTSICMSNNIKFVFWSIFWEESGTSGLVLVNKTF